MAADLVSGSRLKIIWLCVVIGLSLPLFSGCQSSQEPVPEIIPPAQTVVLAIEPTTTFPPSPPPSTRVNLSPTADSTAELAVKPTVTTLPATTAPATQQPKITPTLSADDPVFSGTSIDELTARNYGSGEFTFTETITRNAEFHQYTFEYFSDDQRVEGFLTLPAGTGEFGEKFPVLLLLHGYVPPDEYELFPYSTRYVMPFVEAGYIVIHPSYRGHPPQPDSSGKNIFRIEYAIDILNLIGLIREGSEDLAGPFRRADKDNLFLWGHSMGGGITQRVITVRPDWVSAAALYASMNGDEARNYERIRKWGDERTWQAEFLAPPEVIKQVSPIFFVDRWQTPLTIHHGDKDEIVPPEWSRELCEQLKSVNHPVECYEYFSHRHNLYGSAEDAFTTRIISFFEKHKR